MSRLQWFLKLQFFLVDKMHEYKKMKLIVYMILFMLFLLFFLVFLSFMISSFRVGLPGTVSFSYALINARIFILFAKLKRKTANVMIEKNKVVACSFTDAQNICPGQSRKNIKHEIQGRCKVKKKHNLLLIRNYQYIKCFIFSII